VVRTLFRVSVAAGVFCAAIFGTALTPAIAAPTAGPVPTVVPGSSSAGEASPNASTYSGASADAAAATCAFNQAGDYVHISSSAFEASGHGWWVNIDCPPATVAVVTVQLQEYYSDNTWHNVGTVGRATVASGGGSGNRATGRGACTGSALASWRSVIDVDLVGLSDDASKLTTSYKNLNCTL